jgi:hypothetical protein
MTERGKGRVRLLFLVLALANVLAFAFLRIRVEPNEAAALRIKEVQINAGSVKLLGAATRGADQAIAAPDTPSVEGATAACLEWGPLSGEDVAAADSALEKLGLAHPATRRPVPDAEGGVERFAYFVREPDTATVGQITELQRTFPDTQINAGKCPEDLAAVPAAPDDQPR